MATYKDTEEILRKIYNLANKSTLGETNLSYLDWKDAVHIIKEAPVVDVVGVVRCKDCKQAEELPSGLFRCKLHSVYTAFYDSVFNVKADDFCSYGERKEE